MASKRKARYWIINLDTKEGQKILFGPAPFGRNFMSQYRFYVDIVGLKNCVIVQEVFFNEQAL